MKSALHQLSSETGINRLDSSQNCLMRNTFDPPHEEKLSDKSCHCIPDRLDEFLDAMMELYNEWLAKVDQNELYFQYQELAESCLSSNQHYSTLNWRFIL